VTVLAYHRIETPDNPDLAPTVIDAYPSDFEAQMRYVAARYNVISSWDLVGALREGKTLPKRAMILTFDDGYRSFREAAMPVLRRLGLPVSLFVVTHCAGQVGTPFWWDSLYRSLMQPCRHEIQVPRLGTLRLGTPRQRLRAFERLVYHIERTPWREAEELGEAVLEMCAVEPSTERHLLNWDEIGELAEEGVTIGAHTRHHPVLARVTTDRAHSEISGSWNDLQGHIPNPLPLFCYPTGKEHAVNAAVRKMVRDAGFVGAYTMVAGLNTVGRTDPYHLYRVGMVAGEPFVRFAFKITGAGRFYRKVKASLRRRA
jgi:peptidoglycan/xylan/chitin deacetylase (PgdA/CDA1 family)